MQLLLWLHCSAVVFFHDMRMSPWTNLITPMGLKDSATFVSLEGKGQEFMTYGGRWSLITLWLVSSHNIISRGLTPVCVSDTSGVTWRVWRAMCVTYKERILSLLPSRPEAPVVGCTRLWQGNGQIGDKTWAQAFSEKNVSCLTCLSQLKCLHLKQNYSIVNHNELQSLRSLPARHKRKDIEGSNSLRKFGVSQIISTSYFQLLIGWSSVINSSVVTCILFPCPTPAIRENLFHVIYSDSSLD